MQTILILGAGRSSIFLIEYLARYGQTNGYTLKVCDRDTSLLEGMGLQQFDNIALHRFDIDDLAILENLVAQSVMVVSLLPAALHIRIAKVCLAKGRHLATASYVSDEMKALNPEVQQKGLVFLNELGLDPGLDHLSAMRVINRIKALGGNITGFESYCGGLIADDCDGDNPWKYKFTWNPRNVVLAGQGGAARFLQHGAFKYIPYQQLFRRTDTITVQGKTYEGYANRDSLKYLDLYQLHNTGTMYRGTLRKAGYCSAWNILVQLGMTDDSYIIDTVAGKSCRQFTENFLPAGEGDTETRLKQYCHADNDVIEKLRWLGLFSDAPLPCSEGSPAQILEALLKDKWALQPGDRDMVVMYHLFDYTLNGETKRCESALVVTGDNPLHTAMAKTVGLPLAMGVRLLLEGRIHERGVIIPVSAEFYHPILNELEQYQIIFNEYEHC